MYRRKGRILAGLLALILVCTSSGVSVLADEGTDQEYMAGLCPHHPEHTEDCGYDVASGTSCAYVCDICGDNVSEESSDEDNSVRNEENESVQDGAATSGGESDSVQSAEQSAPGLTAPAEAADTKEITEWTWVDEDRILQESDGIWEIGVPGASEDNPLTQDALLEMLPKQINVTLSDGGEETVDLTWDLSAIPEEGVWSGDYTVSAEVRGTYSFSESTAPLSIEVEVGGAETLDLSDHIVEGETPEGTTINLFDYWNTNNYSDTEIDGESNHGINDGHQLHFNAGKVNNVLNSWTGQGNGPRQGLVMKTLQNGYPSLKEGRISGWINGVNKGYNGWQDIQQESLAYLFDSSSINGKKAYMDVGGLLQIDNDGYYYYNASSAALKSAGGSFESANFASFDENTNSFILYDTYAVNNTGTNSPDGQFFPFNSGEDVFEQLQNGNIHAKGITSNNAVINHYFGMTMSSRFVQKDGGTTDGTTPVTYEFSGDDDVWVYIDDVLVGDLGGIHDAASLTIDFSTGSVVVRNVGKEIVQETTLKQLFIDALGESNVNANLFSTEAGKINTFADNTYHTLDFFYLERGNNDSNISLKYNLVTVPESSVIKVDQAGEPVAGAEFSLYAADEDYQILDLNDPIATGTTESDGKFIFMDEEEKILTLSDIYLATRSGKVVLKETKVPEGYRSVGEYHLYFSETAENELLLLSANEWETGAYASARVTVSTSEDVQTTNGTKNLTNGTMFAVILQYQGQGTTGLQDIANWKAVYGDPMNGWKVTENADMDAILAAAKENPNEFILSSSGSYDVTVDDLPGDINTYYYVLDDGSKENTKYSIGYFYTEASSVQGANTYNTWKVTNSDDFDRVFSANLYVPNIKNNLYVQKLDESGEPVSATTEGSATFALYESQYVSVADDGTYTINNGATAYQTVETEDMTSPLELTGGAMFTGIKEGTYYLIETEAPEGYIKSTTAVPVVVDSTGVYANAGTANDGVTVCRGVGSIVHSMLQFATDDAIDATLHDIKATLVTALSGQGTFEFGTWAEQSTPELHLQFVEGSIYLNYSALSGAESDRYFELTEGWSKLAIYQCTNEEHTGGTKSPKHILTDQNLVNLFSGTTVVRVENQRINSLTISKTVLDESETVLSDQNFSFTLTGTKADLSALSGSYSAERTSAAGTTSTENVQFADGKALLTLTDGESITLTNLPTGAVIKVTEAEVEGATYDTTYTVDGGEVQTGKETGDLEITSNGSVNVAFTNTYVPTADFSFKKTDKDGNALSGAVFALYRLSCSESHDHSEDKISVNENGKFLEDYTYKDCWTLVQTAESDDITGEVQFTDIPAEGEYRLVEIKTPDGYAAPGGQWKIVYSDGRFQPKGNGDASVGNPPAIKEETEGDNVTYSIINYQPGELPFSGNTGIRMFLLIGGMLMILGAAGGTGWYLYHRKSMVVHGHRRSRRK